MKDLIFIISLHGKQWRRIIFLIPLFVLILCSAAEADSEKIERVSEEKVTKALTLIEQRTKGRKLSVDKRKWAEVIAHYAGPKLDWDRVISKQTTVIDDAVRFYKPEVWPAIAAVLTIVDEFNQNYEAWTGKGGAQILTPRQAQWLNIGLFKDIRSQKTAFILMEPTYFTGAAVSRLGNRRLIHLPPSFIDAPLKADVLHFKRIVYHEAHHMISDNQMAGPHNEVDAEIFSIQAAILLAGKEKTRDVYLSDKLFPEQAELLQTSLREIKDKAFLERFFHILDAHLKMEDHKHIRTIVDVAEEEMNSGKVNQPERDKFALDLSRIHLVNEIVSYAINTSLFVQTTRGLIAKGELPVPYHEYYGQFLMLPETIDQVIKNSGQTLNLNTAEYHLQLMATMIRGASLMAKGQKPEAERILKKEIIGQSLTPHGYASLVNGDLQWLLGPFTMPIIPVTMVEDPATAKRYRDDDAKPFNESYMGDTLSAFQAQTDL